MLKEPEGLLGVLNEGVPLVRGVEGFWAGEAADDRGWPGTNAGAVALGTKAPALGLRLDIGKADVLQSDPLKKKAWRGTMLEYSTSARWGRVTAVDDHWNWSFRHNTTTSDLSLASLYRGRKTKSSQRQHCETNPLSRL